jgi:hypothetical protein
MKSTGANKQGDFHIGSTRPLAPEVVVAVAAKASVAVETKADEAA